MFWSWCGIQWKVISLHFHDWKGILVIVNPCSSVEADTQPLSAASPQGAAVPSCRLAQILLISRKVKEKKKKIKDCRDLTLRYDLAYKNPSPKSELCGKLPLLRPQSGQGKPQQNPNLCPRTVSTCKLNMSDTRTLRAHKHKMQWCCFFYWDTCQSRRVLSVSQIWLQASAWHDPPGSFLPFLGTLRVHCAYCM